MTRQQPAAATGSRVTVRDIAKAVGVAPSTVSRALSQPHMVAAAKRDAIRRAADEMGYRPNRAAKELATGRTENIGLIVPDLANPAYSGFIGVIQRQARQHNYATMVADSEEDARLESQLLQFLARKVDGLVVFSPRSNPETLLEHAARIRMVTVHRPIEGIPGIEIDNAGGMVRAVTHLRALGHQVIAHVCGPADSWSDKERTRGITQASDGLDIREIGHVAPSSFSGGVAVADQVLASDATAVICYNDLIALGVLNRVIARGLRVPDDLSILGFDDIPAAELVSPALTTLSVPFAQIGQETLWMLLADIGHEEPVQRVIFEPSLVVRGSTGVASPRPGTGWRPNR